MRVRFYLKCVDKSGDTTTYRFVSEQDLLGFVAQSSTLGLAIVDTHMAFYDVALLAPVFGLHIDNIDHMDINLAKDGSIYGQNHQSNKGQLKFDCDDKIIAYNHADKSKKDELLKQRKKDKKSPKFLKKIKKKLKDNKKKKAKNKTKDKK